MLCKDDDDVDDDDDVEKKRVCFREKESVFCSDGGDGKIPRTSHDHYIKSGLRVYGAILCRHVIQLRQI